MGVEIINNIYAEMAKRNLKRHMARTVLATIGIIIGVVSISSVGMLGNSLKLSATDSLGSVGDQVVLYPAYGESSISKRQVNEIEKVDGLKKIIPVFSNSAKVEYKSEFTYATIYWIDKDDLRYLVKMNDGKFFRSNSKDCVVGAKMAESFDLRLGDKIAINSSQLRIVGILEEGGIGIGVSPDRAIFISQEKYDQLYQIQNDEYTSLVLIVKNLDDISSVKKSIEERLNKKEEVVNVLATDSLLQGISGLFNAISLFLMGMASISLLVAGVGILNVMLMSTIERTKDIGVMKAIGASRTDIAKIFIMESLLLGLSASVIGGILSFGVGIIINILILKDVTYLFTLSSIMYIFAGILFGSITSLVGGVYPALKASKMSPLEALRYD
jgi:putative ABC transport system permease protein